MFVFLVHIFADRGRSAVDMFLTTAPPIDDFRYLVSAQLHCSDRDMHMWSERPCGHFFRSALLYVRIYKAFQILRKAYRYLVLQFSYRWQFFLQSVSQSVTTAPTFCNKLNLACKFRKKHFQSIKIFSHQACSSNVISLSTSKILMLW